MKVPKKVPFLDPADFLAPLYFSSQSSNELFKEMEKKQLNTLTASVSVNIEEDITL